MTLRDQLQESLGGDYAIRDELGGGGMSQVFLADDLKLGRQVVIKVLAAELGAGINAERFAREIRVVASLQQANIVPLLTAGETGGIPYFTMPYVEGKSLRQRLVAGPPLTVTESIGILRDVAHALGYAHEHGVVHRDIKPENVLLSRGTAAVTDFGIAKALAASQDSADAKDHSTLTHLGTSIGTPAYMAPEQAAGDRNLDHRADIYAVGVMAYEMLEGHVPFGGTPQAIMGAHVTTPPPAMRVRPELPASIRRIVMKCLEKDPDRRYATADALLADLDAVATPSGSIASVQRRRRNRWLVILGLGTAWIVAVGAWLGTAHWRNVRWARNEALPRIKAYSNLAQYDSAWYLANRVRTILPPDSALQFLWLQFSRKAVLHSTPEGASVYRATFGDTAHLDPDRDHADRHDSAADRVRASAVSNDRVSGRNTAWIASGSRTFMLDSSNAPNVEMAHLPGGNMDVFLVGLDAIPPIRLRGLLHRQA